jgi:hypothetical protein
LGIISEYTHYVDAFTSTQHPRESMGNIFTWRRQANSTVILMKKNPHRPNRRGRNITAGLTCADRSSFLTDIIIQR